MSRYWRVRIGIDGGFVGIVAIGGYIYSAQWWTLVHIAGWWWELKGESRLCVSKVTSANIRRASIAVGGPFCNIIGQRHKIV